MQYRCIRGGEDRLVRTLTGRAALSTIAVVAAHQVVLRLQEPLAAPGQGPMVAPVLKTTHRREESTCEDW